MLLSVAQYRISYENKAENMLACERMCALAEGAGARVIVFPELSLTGFSLNAALAEESDGDTVRFFSSCAVRYGLVVVFGYAEKSGDKIRNILAVVDECGNVIGRYAKIHPFSYGGENNVFSAGDTIVSFTVDGISIGLSICYDLRFPELYQRLAERCSCIIVSANWAAARAEHWSALLRARAIETQCYVAGCNCICDCEAPSSGDSVIFSPYGEALALAGTEEQLISAEISAQAVDSYRCAFPQRKDRRNEIYRNFYE
ncbi:MAG: nitrilase-related carbon-nitrogen hydrolase [Oscillospiraceae bacterium]